METLILRTFTPTRDRVQLLQRTRFPSDDGLNAALASYALDGWRVTAVNRVEGQVEVTIAR